MKKSVLLASAAIMMCYFTSCSGGKKTEEAAAPAEEAKTEAAVPEYKLMNDLPTVDLSTFPKARALYLQEQKEPPRIFVTPLTQTA